MTNFWRILNALRQLLWPRTVFRRYSVVSADLQVSLKRQILEKLEKKFRFGSDGDPDLGEACRRSSSFRSLPQSITSHTPNHEAKHRHPIGTSKT